MITRACTLIAPALLVALIGFAAAPPEAAAQTAPVNPTELSVQEEALLDALGSGEPLSGRVSIPNERAGDLIKPSGRDWSALQSGTIYKVTLWTLLGMLAALAVYYLVRGRIRIEGGRSGRTLRRFGGVERFAHWLTAAPFVLLALSGLNMVLGRRLLLPLIGPEAFATVSAWAKLAHNFLAWPFMLGLLLIFVVWVKDNVPSRADATWIAQGGGMFGKGAHLETRRFNAGQKLVFWAVVLGGAALSVTGFYLIFPALAGTAATWQTLQVIHGLVAAGLGMVILGHIYLGSIGMEGAFDAMRSGEVDLNWAKEHHSQWVEEELAAKGGGAAPAKGRIAPAE